jgi:hypothetical protein
VLFGSLTRSTSAPFRAGDLHVVVALSGRLCLPCAFRLPAFASWTVLSSWRIVPSLRKRPTGLRHQRNARPHEGFHVPHSQDVIGVGVLCTPGPYGVHMQVHKHLHALAAVHRPLPPSPTRRLEQPTSSAINSNEASTRIHSRSPVRSFPRPSTPVGSPPRRVFSIATGPLRCQGRPEEQGTGLDTGLDSRWHPPPITCIVRLRVAIVSLYCIPAARHIQRRHDQATGVS